MVQTITALICYGLYVLPKLLVERMLGESIPVAKDDELHPGACHGYVHASQVT